MSFERGDFQDRHDHDLIVEAVVDIKSMKERTERIYTCVFGDPDADDTGLKGKVDRVDRKIYYAFAALGGVWGVILLMLVKLLGG